MSYSSRLQDESSTPESEPLADRLPVQLTSFIGRERAMEEIARLFSGARLVTLTGPGGGGKTRLALQTAPLLRQALQRDAVWVDLASINDGGLIPQTIARPMQVAEAPDGTLIDAVIAHLRRHDPLLILDNAEHIIGPLAETVELLLTRCPSLRLLITSREALNIPGETAWSVPALTVPDDLQFNLDSNSSEAARLFVERARAVEPSFALTQTNAPHVVEICRRLDGMPLAIELAASRMNLLGAAEVASRLEQSFHLLTAGRRTALPRHRTLQATIDWSFELLSEPERRLFARLSVFNGGFKLDAVENVCSGDGLPSEDLLDLFAQLSAKSLIAVDRRGSSTRFRMLQTIQQYAREKLAESGELDQLRERHARWCVALAQSGAELESTGQVQVVERFEAEHDNLRTAMSWALENDEPEMLARIAGALWRFWLMRGYLEEGTRWLAAAAERLADDCPARADVLLGRAVLSCHQADYSAAREFFGEALTIWQSTGDRNGQGEALYGLATADQFQGRYADAARHFEEALGVFQHPRGRALSLMGLAMTLVYTGETERAAQLCEESLAICRSLSDDRSVASALTTLGIIALTSGDLDRAAEICTRSLELRQELGDRGGVAHTLTIQGYIALERGDLTAAEHEFRDALQLRQEMGDAAAMTGPIEGFSAVSITRGDLESGVRTMALAETLRHRHETPRSPVEQSIRDRYLEMAREQLGERDFDRAWEEGRTGDAMALGRLAHDVEHNVDVSVAQTAEALGRVEPSTSVELIIEALGHSRVLRQGREIDASDWIYSKARELLFYLLQAGASTKEQIGLALWPDVTDVQLRRAFHTTLHHLRRALGDPGWVLFRNGTYAFNRARSFSYDVGEFERELSRTRERKAADQEAAIASLERALAIYQGKYLSDLPDADWHLQRQEELEREQVNALLLLGDLLMAGARPVAAETIYRRAIAADEFLESAHRGLMQALAIQGERGKALRHYQVLTALLRDELSAEPDLSSRQLYEKIRSETTTS